MMAANPKDRNTGRESEYTEPLLPQNVEAEAGVLGSLLIDPDALSLVADRLLADEFSREAHRLIYAAASDLFNAGQPADLITLVDELSRRGDLDAVGGISYVSSLANQVPTSANIRYYAAIVTRTATLRRLIDAASHIAAVAYREPDADLALDAAERLIEGVRGTGAFAREVRRLGVGANAFAERLERIQLARRRGEVLGVPSGFGAQDRLTGGFERGDLVIVAARPSVGKTSYALSMLDTMARGHGVPVGYFTLEMPEEQILARLVSMGSGVDVQALRTGAFGDRDWEAVMRALGDLHDAPIYVDDTPALTLARLRARARYLVRHEGVQVLMVDYLQLMDGARDVSATGGYGGKGNGGGGGGGYTRRPENRQQEVSELSRGLKALARDLDVPVIALSQLSRAVEARQDKHPQLSDLRESGSQEQDADVVLLLYRDEIYNPDTERPHIADVIVAKHRNGPTGTFSLYFQSAQARYRDLETTHHGDEGEGYGGGRGEDTAWRSGAHDGDTTGGAHTWTQVRIEEDEEDAEGERF